MSGKAGFGLGVLVTIAAIVVVALVAIAREERKDRDPK